MSSPRASGTQLAREPYTVSLDASSSGGVFVRLRSPNLRHAYRLRDIVQRQGLFFPGSSAMPDGVYVIAPTGMSKSTLRLRLLTGLLATGRIDIEN